MKRRTWKMIALATAGGVLFQLASCIPLLTDTLMTNLLPLILTQFLTGAAGSTP